MKIKKKEYQKQLDDAYWKGVNVGMKFALNNPNDAKNFVDRTEALKRIIEPVEKAFEGIGKALSNCFNK